MFKLKDLKILLNKCKNKCKQIKYHKMYFFIFQEKSYIIRLKLWYGILKSKTKNLNISKWNNGIKLKYLR